LTFTFTGIPTPVPPATTNPPLSAADFALIFADLPADATSGGTIPAGYAGNYTGTLAGYTSDPTGTIFTSTTVGTNIATDMTVSGIAASTVAVNQGGASIIERTGLLPLQNPLGYKVLDEQGQPIFIPEVYVQDFGTATAKPYTFQKITTVENNGIISVLYADAQGNPLTAYYAGSQSTYANGYVDTNIAYAQRVGYATVNNPPALSKEGGNLFRPTVTSGTPTIGKANGNNSKVFSNSLEQSNVDMAAQFVKMILTQRAYSANSKTITTADEMTQEVLNLKR
jgi:flagellar hook protein FlgE